MVQDENETSIEKITLSTGTTSYGVALYWITVDGVFVTDENATYDNTYDTFGTGWTNNPTKSGSNRIDVRNKTLNITFNPPIPNGEVKFCVSGPSSGGGTIQINDKDCPRWDTSNPDGVTTPDFQFTSDPPVKVIGQDKDASPPTITVDGGDWTTSTLIGNYSANTTGTENATYPKENLFDGDLATEALPGPGGTAGKWSLTTDTSANPIVCTSFEVYLVRDTAANANAYVSLNDVEIQIADKTKGWQSVLVPVNTTLNSFSVTREATTGSNNGVYFGAVKINNQLVLIQGPVVTTSCLKKRLTTPRLLLLGLLTLAMTSPAQHLAQTALMRLGLTAKRLIS